MDALLSPEWGTVIWSTIAFLVVAFLLKKMAWKPILKSLSEREESIADSLNQAEKARQEMQNLQSDNERLMKEAREERDQLLREARDMRDKIVADAKNSAKEEGEKLISNAREAIHNEKMAAMSELKNQVGALSVDIAQQIVKGHLKDESSQQDLIKTMLDGAKLN